MSTGSRDLTRDEILKIHKSVIEECKDSQEFRDWFIENGADAIFQDPSTLEVISEDYFKYSDDCSVLRDYLIKKNTKFVEGSLLICEDGSICYPNGATILALGITEVLDSHIFRLYSVEKNANDVRSVSYPKEMVYYPLVLEKLLLGTASYTTGVGYRTSIEMCVEQTTCDFDEFIPNVLEPKYKWSKPGKLGLDFGKLIEDMYLSSAADFTLSSYDCSIIKISMIEGQLCFTCITGDRVDVVVPYSMVRKGLVRSIMSSLPMDYSKVKEVYILYNDLDTCIENYIARKCDDGEYVLTLF